MALFINYTNHPSAVWSAEQLAAAGKLGTVTDLPFPDIPAGWSPELVAAFADAETARILALKPAAVLCQGEFTFCHAVITRLTQNGVPCYAACSERTVTETQSPEGSTIKKAVFRFTRFRQYE